MYGHCCRAVLCLRRRKSFFISKCFCIFKNVDFTPVNQDKGKLKRRENSNEGNVWFPLCTSGLMCFSVWNCSWAEEESLLAGRWLLQPELCERTSSLLPAFVQSTSYCRAVQLGPGERLTDKESGVEGILFTCERKWMKNGEKKKLSISAALWQKCQALTALQMFISLIISQASSKCKSRLWASFVRS